MDESQLLTGDVLMSFKSKDFIKNNLLAKLLYMGQSSLGSVTQVDHLHMALRIGNVIKIVDSFILAGGVQLKNFELENWAVFIVLRPKISQNQRISIIRSIREFLQNKTKFATFKMVGVAPSDMLNKSVNLFSKGYRVIPHLFGSGRTHFCSSFVNEVFKDAGIMLTPKSRYSHMVTPPDILTSPVLKFVGLIFNDAEKDPKTIMRYLSDAKL